ncbi:MAG: NIPSNAP family protein [Granulicella sp.]
MITGVAAMSALLKSEARASELGQTFLELKTWRLHNSGEDQAKRVSAYLEGGLFPALTRAGAKPVGAFANLIGQDGPYLVSIAQYSSLASMQEVLAKLAQDKAHEKTSRQLSDGAGVPFVRIESSLLKTLSSFPEAVLPDDAGKRPSRIFEMRTYESQSMATLQRKAHMFNNGEIGIFQRLGMRPVFFGETIIGPRQPCITYMLSFDKLDAREKLWQQFGSDPEWKRISAPPEMHDAEIVANIGNVILRPLPFSPVR